MSKEIYVLKNQIHFGTLKTSVPKGTKIILDREHNKVMINETEHDNISQIEMCIKHGFIIPFDENVQIDTKIKVSPSAFKNKQKQYKIEKSDVDSMKEDILVPKKQKKQEVKKEKNKKMQIIKQGNVTESRGMQVISSDEQMKQVINSEQKMEVIHADQGKVIAKIPAKKQVNKLVDANKEDISVIMGQQGKVVKRIGKSVVNNIKNEDNEIKSSKTAGKLVTKKASKESIQKANEKAKARKKKA